MPASNLGGGDRARVAANGDRSWDCYRNEATAMAAGPDVTFQVDVRHVDAGTFAEARAFNERVAGMAGMAVRNDDGELLFIDHEGYGGWVFPGGVVESDESFHDAAVREVREESGVEAAVVRPLLVRQFVPRHDGRSTDNFFVLFEGRAVDDGTAEDPGQADEPIADVTWTDTVPDPIADDRTVRATVEIATERFDTVGGRSSRPRGRTGPVP